MLLRPPKHRNINLIYYLDELRIFKVVKRESPFLLWEPIFIGTNEDPLYDERLTWEGKRDKMTQVRHA